MTIFSHTCVRCRKPAPRMVRARHSGFTLVEMMVAVTLVLLIMSMFAQVFQLAGGTITTQRGIAENDQRSRVLQNLIKSDLDKRTFRTVMPWARAEDGSLAEAMATQRMGYLYISENDPNSSRDDFLQFTISVDILSKNRDASPLYGKAIPIPNAGNLLAFPNQPEADDGWPNPNEIGESTAAEVSYFLRGDRLYRRVLLLRKPLALDVTNPQPGYLDHSVSPSVYRDFFDPDLSYYGTSRSFWEDFDYSAFPLTDLGHARFHGVDDLNNASVQTQFALGKPRYRFGHRRDLRTSREFDGSGNFFGRYTHEETSNANFHYPQAGPNFMNNPPGSFNMTTSVFTTLSGGSRRGEDLVMTNVHEFDVKVWDPLANGGFGRFVDIGGSDAVAFLPANRQNATYGPWGLAENPGASHFNNVFDTWFPFPFVDGVNVTAPEMDLDGDGQNDLAPYRPLWHTRTSGGPTLWGPQVYNAGDEVFPTLANSRNNGLRFYYRCVQGGGGPGSVEPTMQEWPSSPGARFQKAPGEPVWEAVDNWRPLQAIQITIRFVDPTSDQMRQLTVVHSLVD